MENESETSPDGPADVPPPDDMPAHPRRRRSRWPWVVAGIILLPIALLALWTVIALNYSYSRGRRAGYVQKFSRKGWICKTYEGELAMVNVPGAMQERWEFTVRNDSIAQILSNSMGQRVSLTYNQHTGVPTSCFGETQYFVTGIQVLGQ